jgi:glucose-1-phosphate thymidylyltransferase
MEIAKALIMAGRTRDDRGYPADLGGSAHLFPIANRPLLFHILEALGAAGVLEATILTDGDGDGPTRRAVGDGGRWRLGARVIDWKPSSGLAGALAAAEEYLGGEPVLVQDAGSLLHEHLHAHISSFARDRLDALALRLPTSAGSDDSPCTPVFLLSPEAIGLVLGSPELGRDPVSGVRAQGGRTRVGQVDGCDVSTGHIDALLEANRRALEGLITSVDPASFADCTVQGPVSVHRTARLERTLLRGPIVIGPGARLIDAYIGPYTSIGADARIEGAQIEHSIVLADAELRFVGARLESSLIGRGARVSRGFQLPGAMRVAIGSGAKVTLP